MAASTFPRPDPSSPASIARASFATTRKGFDQGEVQSFLNEVAAEMERLRQREQQLEQALLEARDAHNRPIQGIDDATATRLLGEEAANILQAARQSASIVKAKAEDGAATLLGEATDEAGRVREEAELEAARRRSDATADAEMQISMAKEQGRQMVNEARLYRERVLGELSRRRELARSQIEQLVRSREQIVASFSAARDAADGALDRIGPIDDEETELDLTPPEIPTVAEGELPAPESGAGDDTDGAALFDQGSGDSVDGEPAAPAYVDEGVPEDVASEDVAPSETAAPDDLGAARAARSARVVELFPGAPGGDDGAVGGGGSSATVDSLFAKLRAASVDDDVAQAPEAPPDDVDADAVTTVPDTAELPVTDEEVGTPFQRRDAELTPLIVAAARRVKRVLADEQNEVLDALRRGEPAHTVDTLLADEARRSARFVDAIANELEVATMSGAASVTGEPSPEVTRLGALGPVHELFTSSIVAPLRERIERAVADGDGDNNAVAKRVRSVYREWKANEVDDTLDDVFRLAYGRGVLVALPEGTPVHWIVDPDGPACPDAEDNSLAGAVPAGDEFPTGHVCAPAHDKCRCLLEPAEH